MNTTALVVDYLIIGVEGCCWILLFVATVNEVIVGKNWVTQLKDLPNAPTAILLGLAIVFVYAVGILFNEAYHVVFKKYIETKKSDRILKDRFSSLTNQPEGWDFVRNYIGHCSNYLARRFEDWNHRKMRILRATAANFALIGFLIFTYSWVASGFMGPRAFDMQIAFIVFTFWVLAGLALWLWYRSIKRYYNRLADIYCFLNHREQERISRQFRREPQLSQEVKS